MNKDFFFNGEKFISAKRAAEETGFTPDHVAALARDQKILGKRIGRTWYVSRDSVVAYKKGDPVVVPKNISISLSPETAGQSNTGDLYFQGERFISSQGAAKLLGYAPDHVAALARKGAVPARMMGRTWYVSRSAILAYKRGLKPAKPIRMRKVHTAKPAELFLPKPKSVVPISLPSPVTQPIEVGMKAEALARVLPVVVEVQLPAGPTVFDHSFNRAVIAVASVFAIGLSGTYLLGASSPETDAAFSARLASADTASVISSIAGLFGNKSGKTSAPAATSSSAGPANPSSITAILDGLPATAPAALEIDKLKADLKAEIDAYAKSRLGTEVAAAAPSKAQVPITVAFNQTVFKTEVLGEANAHTSIQSTTDVDLLSVGLSSLRNNAIFLNPTITGGALTGVSITGNFSGSATTTNLSFESAIGTSATSTNLYSPNFTADTARLTTVLITNATTTNATSTNSFATTASSTNLYSTTANVGNLSYGNATGTAATTTSLFSHIGTFDNVYVNNYQQNNGTFTISSTVPSGDIFSVLDSAITNGTLIHQSLTANAGNGQVSKGQIIDLTDNTSAGGGYSAFTINASGTGNGSGSKTLLDLNPGANKEIVFDSTGALRPTTDVSQNTTSIGTPSFYFKNGYFDTITANNIAGTVVSGATASHTWTVGSNETGDVNEALVFQRNSGSGNATFSWNTSNGTLNDQRFLSVNYPFNATYTVNDSSIATTTSLYSGLLTNNTTSGTQKLLSLTNTGTGTTEDGIYLNNTGTGLNAIEIVGTWTKGLVTNNNSVDIGTGGLLFGTATGTSATTTNFFATNLSSSNYSVTNLNFTNATGTNLFASVASSTSLFASTASVNGTAFNVTSGGNVGIGITNPSAKLTVSGGDIAVSGSTNGITFANSQSIRDGGVSGDLTLFTPTTGGAINLNTTNGNILFSPGTASVGIGTTTPKGLLQLARDVSALPTSSVYGQLELTLTSNPTSRLSAGYSSTFDAGFLQAISGSTNKPLLLNPQGGNVGIGTTTPVHNLEIVSSTGPDLQLSRTGQPGRFMNIGYNGVFNTGTDGYQFNVNGTNSINSTVASGRVTIGNNTNQDVNRLGVNGNVGIGTTYNAIAAPTNGLIVEGNVGIGTTTPASALAISGGVTIGANYNVAAPVNGLAVQGRVAVGTTTSPGYPLAIQALGGAAALDLLGRSSDNISTLQFDNVNGTGANNYIQGNNSWLRMRGDGGVHFAIGSTPDTTNTAYTFEGGNVGIGVTNPSDKLVVSGNVTITGNSTTTNATTTYSYVSNKLTIGSALRMTQNSNGAFFDAYLVDGADRTVFRPALDSAGYLWSNNVGNQVWMSLVGNGGGATTLTVPLQTAAIFGTDPGGSQFLRVGGSATFNGTVGIGKTNPSSTLDVNGTITSSPGSVTLGLWVANGSGYQLAGNGTSITGAANELVMNGGNNGASLTINATGFLFKRNDAGTTPVTFNRLAPDNSLVLTSAGKLGVGTSTPADLLTVASTASGSDMGGITLTNNAGLVDGSASTLSFAYDSNGHFLSQIRATDVGTNASGKLDFITKNGGAGVNAMTILPSGNVGIGVTNPGDALDVNGLITRVGSGGGNVQLILGSASPAADNGGRLIFQNTNAVHNWQLDNNNLVSDTFNITPSTANGGSSFTSPILSIKASGNVGINASVPVAPLHVVKNASGAPANSGSASTGIARFNDTSTRQALDFGSIASSPHPMWLQAYSDTLNLALTNPLALNPNGGNVGIGTTAPSQALDVTGFINTDQFSGYKQAGNTILYASSTRGTLGIGISTLSNYASTGLNNIAIGNGVLTGNVTGNNNLGIGVSTLNALTSGAQNVTIGSLAGAALTSGGDNVAIGYNTLVTATSTGSNVAIGSGALNVLSDPGAQNVAIGLNAGSGLTTGSSNVFLGYRTGVGVTTGTSNIIIGANGGSTGITTGSSNVIIGNSVSGLSSSLSNTVILADGGGNQRLYINSGGNVGIGTSTPSLKLHLEGSADTLGLMINRTSSNNGTVQWANNGTSDWTFGQIPNGGVAGNGRDLTFFSYGGPGTVMEIQRTTGNVGIGVTNPSNKLTLSAGSELGLIRPDGGDTVKLGTDNADNLLIRNSANSYVAVIANSFGNPAGGATVGMTFPNSTSVQIGVNGVGAYVNSSNNVGIGTTNPGQRLEVNGFILNNGPATQTGMIVDNAGTNASYFGTESGWTGAGTSVNTVIAGYSGSSIKFITNGASISSPAMVINTSGNVGIGTTNPSVALDVNGTIGMPNSTKSSGTLTTTSGGCVTTNDSTHATLSNNPGATTADIFYNSTRTKHARITSTATCTDGSAVVHQVLTLSDSITGNTTGDSFTLYTPVGDLGNSTNEFINNGYIINMKSVASTVTGGFDLAEQYQSFDQTLEDGDIVSVDPLLSEGVKRSSAGDPAPLGVISEHAPLTLGDNGPGWKKVALAGRVDAKVTEENGAIAPGDYLALSATQPGKLAKATKAGIVLGQALEDDHNGVVKVFVSHFYYDPAEATTTASTTSERVAALELKVSALEGLIGSGSNSALTLDATTSSAVADGFFAEASLALKQGIQALGQIGVIHNAIYAVAGVFDKVFAKSVHTDMICVTDAQGETCVTRSQLDTMLAASGQSGTLSGIVSNPVTDSGDASSTPSDTASSTPTGDASSTPAVDGGTATSTRGVVATAPDATSTNSVTP